MSVKVYFQLGACFLSIATPANAATPDVTGVALGMSLGQVKQTVGSGFEWHDQGKSSDGEQQQWIATKASEGYAFQWLDNKLIYIEHYQGFNNATKPSEKSTIMALRSKYGISQPVGSGGAYDIFWAYDKSGSPIQSVLGLCPGFPIANVQLDVPYPGPAGRPSVGFPVYPTGGCPVIVKALDGLANSPSSLTLVLYDQNSFYDYLKGTQDKKAATQKATEDANKPKL